MRPKSILAVLCLMLTCTVSSMAQQTPSTGSSIDWSAVPVPSTPATEKSVGAAISPMRKDQRAPFTGVLLSPDAIAQIIVTYTTLPQQIKVYVDQARDTCQAANDKRQADIQATCESARAIDAARMKTQATENARLQKLVDDLESRNNSSLSTSTWIGIGAAGGIVATLGTIYLVNQVVR